MSGTLVYNKGNWLVEQKHWRIWETTPQLYQVHSLRSEDHVKCQRSIFMTVYR